MKYAPTREEIERRNRIRVSLAAYSYEIEAESIMSDAEFDRICLEIDPEQETGDPVLDAFFLLYFDPSTGQWIYDHPELAKIKALYKRLYAPR